MNRRLTRPLAVALLSAGTLAFEILLVRLFAIEQFYHFAYMAIGIAMLGFGASGTLMALVGRLEDGAAARWFIWSAVLAAGSLVATPALVDRITLDPTQILWDPAQWVRLAAVYLLLAVPFGAAALTILLAINLAAEQPGRIYGASFFGSGLGAVSAIAILWLLDPVHALAVPAVLGSLGAAVAALELGRRSRARIVAWAVVFIALAAVWRPLWRLDITPYKSLPQVEAYPNARRIAEPTGPLGWIVVAEAPAFRYAPGLSLAFRGEFPRQFGLFVDGQLAGAATRWESDSAAYAVLDWLPTALPYALGTRDRVLVIGAAGGTEVTNALVHGAREVTAVELLADLVRATRGLMSASETDSGDSRVQWVIADARSFTARSRQAFDLVNIGPAGAPSGVAAGVHSLNEDFLHTVEAYVRYLELLDQRGVLAITRWLTVPPRENVRVILTAVEALRRVAPQHVKDGLVVARSWGTATVLVKPSGFSDHEIDALGTWTRARQFDLDWHQGLETPVPGFHVLAEPTLYHAARAAVSGPEDAAAFASGYPFRVHPVDDARPYPHHFLRAGSLGAFLESGRGNWLPFAEWGYIAIVATLLQSALLAGALLLLPTIVRTRSAFAPRLLPLITYFAAIGLAYLAAEIATIQQLNLLLGHPVYAVAAALTALLVFSGLGSVLSDRVIAERGWQAGALLAIILAAFAIGALWVVHALQASQLVLRAVAALIMLAPMAFLMGLPFPMGLRSLAAADNVRIAWAWAANGFASVVAAPLAALIALEAGSRILFLVAALGYVVAAVILGNQQSLIADR